MTGVKFVFKFIMKLNKKLYLPKITKYTPGMYIIHASGISRDI